MTKLNFILIFSSLIFSLNAQTFNDIIEDKVVNEFINDYLDKFSQKIDKEYNRKICFDNRPIHFDLNSTLRENIDSWNLVYKNSGVNIDSIFNYNDRLFILSQLDSQKDYLWKINHNILKFCKIDSLNSEQEYFRLSMPLFSRSKQIVIIKRILECGSDCGDQEIIIYKLEKNKSEILGGWGLVY